VRIGVVVLLGWLAAMSASAASYTNIAGTPQNWDNNASWTPNTGYPNAADDIAVIAGNSINQDIRLNIPITVGTLVHSNIQLHAVNAGTAGTLTLQTTSGKPTVRVVGQQIRTGGILQLNAPVALTTNTIMDVTFCRRYAPVGLDRRQRLPAVHGTHPGDTGRGRER
jgi:hypothetical protein